MARKLFVSSDIFRDEAVEDVAASDPMAGLMWPWFVVALDDWGRCDASARRIRSEVFPCNPAVTADVVESALQAFAAAGLIVLYEVADKRYAAVDPENWWKYQTHIRAEKREHDTSRIPAPPRAPSRGGAGMRENARDRAGLVKVKAKVSSSPVGGTGESEGDGAAPSEAAVPDSGDCGSPVGTGREAGTGSDTRNRGDASADGACGAPLLVPDNRRVTTDAGGSNPPRSSHPRRAPSPYTPELRAELIEENDGEADIAEQIDLAIAHPAAKKYRDNPRGYLRNWIRRYRNEQDEHEARMARAGPRVYDGTAAFAGHQPEPRETPYEIRLRMDRGISL